MLRFYETFVIHSDHLTLLLHIVVKSLLKRTETNSSLTRYGKVGGRVNYGWSRVTNWRQEGGSCYAIIAQLLCGTMDTRAANCGSRSTRGGDSFPASIAVRSGELPTVTAQLKDTWPQASVYVRNAQTKYNQSHRMHRYTKYSGKEIVLFLSCIFTLFYCFERHL